jgi:[ribosomal protein S5]-alanine N-acetyltransferase
MPLEPNFNPFPVLETPRLHLRQVVAEDIPEIFAMRSNKELMRYIDRPLAETEEDARVLFNRIDTALKNNEGINWGITTKDDNRLAGTIAFWRLDKENYRGEIGYMLQSHLQGKGIMKEAITAILQYGFFTMNLHSVEANINPANKASVALVEKMGFVQEAYFRENYYYDGKFLDSLIYSLLVSDFKPTA